MSQFFLTSFIRPLRLVFVLIILLNVAVAMFGHIQMKGQTEVVGTHARDVARLIAKTNHLSEAVSQQMLAAQRAALAEPTEQALELAEIGAAAARAAQAREALSPLLSAIAGRREVDTLSATHAAYQSALDEFVLRVRSTDHHRAAVVLQASCSHGLPGSQRCCTPCWMGRLAPSTKQPSTRVRGWKRPDWQPHV